MLGINVSTDLGVLAAIDPCYLDKCIVSGGLLEGHEKGMLKTAVNSPGLIKLVLKAIVLYLEVLSLLWNSVLYIQDTTLLVTVDQLPSLPKRW
jgi:hypothetical protein